MVTQNLLTLTARIEQLEMDIKRLEGVIISMIEKKNRGYREDWKAAVRKFSPARSYR